METGKTRAQWWNHPWAGVWLALIASSAFAVALVVVRGAKTWQPAYFNLVWNLVLAWMPVLFAALACRNGVSSCRGWLYAGLWLLFLPNAPYLVTDLVHLRFRPPVPLWYDLILVQVFICTGLLLGYLSLYWMHRQWSEHIGRKSGWGFVVAVAVLTGFGIYLGRFERWNSWDVFVQPIGLAVNLWSMLTTPESYRSAGRFTVVFGAFFLLAYVVLFGLMTQRRTASPTAAMQ